MRVLCVLSRHNYGDPTRGESHEYSHFLPAIRRLGHDVALFDTGDRSTYQSFADLNRALLNLVRDQHPDIVLAVPALYEVWSETWEAIRRRSGAVLIHWACDDAWKYKQASRLLAPCFDVMATTDEAAYANYERDGFHYAFLTQWAADAESLVPPLPARECTYEVTFVGTSHGQRSVWMERARSRGVAVQCFGYGWPNGPVSATGMRGIIRSSVISLNLANSVTRWRGFRREPVLQLKARNFEVPGSGGFLLTEWVPGLSGYYDINLEIATFSDVEAFCAQTKDLLGHPAERDRRAWAAFERTRREHTYDHRFARLFDFAIERRRRRHAPRSSDSSRPVALLDYDAASKRHRVTPVLGAATGLLSAMCTVLWGRARGPRAARRLVFEASWRVAGRRTYSAAGIPGRFFYRSS